MFLFCSFPNSIRLKFVRHCRSVTYRDCHKLIPKRLYLSGSCGIKSLETNNSKTIRLENSSNSQQFTSQAKLWVERLIQHDISHQRKIMKEDKLREHRNINENESTENYDRPTHLSGVDFVFFCRPFLFRKRRRRWSAAFLYLERFHLLSFIIKHEQSSSGVWMISGNQKLPNLMIWSMFFLPTYARSFVVRTTLSLVGLKTSLATKKCSYSFLRFHSYGIIKPFPLLNFVVMNSIASWCVSITIFELESQHINFQLWVAAWWVEATTLSSLSFFVISNEGNFLKGMYSNYLQVFFKLSRKLWGQSNSPVTEKETKS